MSIRYSKIIDIINKIYTFKIMGLSKKLTEKQIKFANILVANEGRKTATECAIEAGYEETSAHIKASQLRNPKLYPLVCAEISRIREEWNKKYEVTYESHIRELARLREEALKKGSFASAVNAEIARGKSSNLYTNISIVKHGSIDQMTTEELELKMRKILEDHKAFITEAEFETVDNKETKLEETTELIENKNN